MRRILFALCLIAGLAVSAHAQGSPPLTIQEVDGTPRKNGVSKIIVTNGTLTCTGTTCTIATGGGGGGGLTIGTTAITSGTAGRILYETSGNVVGEIAGSSVDANGAVQFAATARSSGVAQYFRINTPADTGQTTATESVGAYFGGNGSGSTVTRTWAAGTVATQRENVFVAPTYATGSFTTAATVAITGPPIASGGTITNPSTLLIQSGMLNFATNGSISVPHIGVAGGNVQLYISSGNFSVGRTGLGITFFTVSTSNQVAVGNTTYLGFSGSTSADASGVDAAFYRSAAGVIRVTDGSGTGGRLIIGPSSASTTAADLYIIGNSSSRVALRADSTATPSVDIFQTTVNGVAGTGFVVTSTGAPSSPGAGASSERYGSGATAGGASSIAIGNGATAGGSSSIIIGTSATNNNVGSTIGIGASIGASSSSSQIAIGGSIAASNNPSIVIGFGATTGASNGSNIFIGHTVGSSSGAGVTNNIAIGSAINYLSAQAGLLVFGYTISNANLPAANAAIFGSSTVPYNDVFFGKGYINATPTAYAINGTGGSGSNIAGADVIIAGGKNTGSPTSTATGNVRLATSIVGAAASTLNTLVDRLVIANRKTLTDASTNLFEVALPTLKGCMGTIRYEIYASDGTDIQVRRGQVQFSAVNKAGAYTTEIAILNEAVSASTGTLTAAWGITGGTNKVTIDVTPTGSLTETTYYILYTIENNSEQAITIL